MTNKKICKHGRDPHWCCKCQYGDDSYWYKDKDFRDKVPDMVTYINAPYGRRLSIANS